MPRIVENLQRPQARPKGKMAATISPKSVEVSGRVIDELPKKSKKRSATEDVVDVGKSPKLATKKPTTTKTVKTVKTAATYLPDVRKIIEAWSLEDKRNTIASVSFRIETHKDADRYLCSTGTKNKTLLIDLTFASAEKKATMIIDFLNRMAGYDSFSVDFLKTGDYQSAIIQVLDELVRDPSESYWILFAVPSCNKLADQVKMIASFKTKQEAVAFYGSDVRLLEDDEDDENEKEIYVESLSGREQEVLVPTKEFGNTYAKKLWSSYRCWCGSYPFLLRIVRCHHGESLYKIIEQISNTIH